MKAIPAHIQGMIIDAPRLAGAVALLLIGWPFPFLFVPSLGPASPRWAALWIGTCLMAALILHFAAP
jgi:hypothetical protein